MDKKILHRVTSAPLSLQEEGHECRVPEVYTPCPSAPGDMMSDA